MCASRNFETQFHFLGDLLRKYVFGPVCSIVVSSNLRWLPQIWIMSRKQPDMMPSSSMWRNVFLCAMARFQNLSSSLLVKKVVLSNLLLSNVGQKKKSQAPLVGIHASVGKFLEFTAAEVRLMSLFSALVI